MREYERHQASIAAVHKKVGDYEDRIAREQQKLVDAQKDLAREEDRELKKRMKRKRTGRRTCSSHAPDELKADRA